MTMKGAPDNASRAPGGRCFFFYFLYTLLMIIYRCTYDDEDQHDDHLGPRPLRPLRPSPAGAAAAAGGGGGSAGLEMRKVSSLGMFFFQIYFTNTYLQLLCVRPTPPLTLSPKHPTMTAGTRHHLPSPRRHHFDDDDDDFQRSHVTTATTTSRSRDADASQDPIY